jgi:putative DNA-invertase from lambdoid prophage Rac
MAFPQSISMGSKVQFDTMGYKVIGPYPNLGSIVVSYLYPIDLSEIVKGIAYIRVSTKEQDEEVQKKAIEAFVAQKGIEIAKWYIDKVSGAQLFKRRPGAQELLNELDVLKPECLVSWSLDRLGRDMLDTMSLVLEFESKGIRVITVKEEFLQTLDPTIRKLLLSFFAWIAEFERRRIRERQEEAWNQGKQKGRPMKVKDQIILKYYSEYVVKRGLSIADMQKIMRYDGYEIAYVTLKRRIQKLKKMGKIQIDTKVFV